MSDQACCEKKKKEKEEETKRAESWRFKMVR
jgi:hypothetical protein